MRPGRKIGTDPMEMIEIDACMVLLDISGYTEFVNYRTTSLLHAEQIITELLDSVIEHAEYPLKLNKLEGDAAFLYSPIDDLEATLADIYRQIQGFFGGFRKKQKELISVGAGGCACDACRHIQKLNIKAVMHCGTVVLKQVRQFEELAGEPVILIHRLLKNSVPADGYMLFTKTVYEILHPSVLPELKAYIQHYEHMPPCEVYAYIPDQEPLPRIDLPPVSRWSGMGENLRLWRHSIYRLIKGNKRVFSNLPAGGNKKT